MHCFISWLVHLDRLPTKLRIFKFNANQPTSCELCGAPKSRDHLFFSCSFTSQVWKNVLGTLGKTGPASTSWDQLVAWAQYALKRSTAINLVVKMDFQLAYITYGWRETAGCIMGLLLPFHH